ncbi:hypothetical protein [Aeromicrobium sp. Sec7.5]|uniref:hypothetical protein n=1 Tax=Aeromicrobium sp. Sec7.5 TaxID=3121276 RepID=UPI002FE477CE
MALWNAGDVLSRSVTETDNEAAYVTDVFLRDHKPKPRTRLVALGASSRGLEVIGLGVVHQVDAVATRKDRVRVQPLIQIDPVPVGRIENYIEANLGKRPDLNIPPPLRAQTLGALVADQLLEALRSLSPEVAAFLAKLAEADLRVEGQAGQRMREERDAITTAIDLADMEIPAPLNIDDNPTPDSPLSLVLPEHVMYDIEDDLIAVDLRRFDGRGELKMSSGSAASFRDNRFRLTILNVNRKRLEKVTGVDLIYFDATAGTFTLVQYKRQEPRRNSKPGEERWAYTAESEIKKSLSRMGSAHARMAHTGDFRLTPSPYWFKFVLNRPGESGGSVWWLSRSA